MQYITGDKTAVELEEYKGTYSLSDCFIGKDGDIIKRWAIRQLGKNDDGTPKLANKALPVKVTLGNIDKAIQTLEAILNDLYSTSGTERPKTEDKDFDSIPF